MGKLEDVLSEAVKVLLDRWDPDRRSAVRPVSERVRASDPLARRIPNWVKRRVWRRDWGRCSYIDGEGARCQSRDFLEYDHVVPWALGGPSNDPENIRLLCRTHNQAEARRVFKA